MQSYEPQVHCIMSRPGCSHAKPDKLLTKLLLIPVCNSLARWFQRCSQTHLSTCSDRCLRQLKQTW